MFNFFRRKKKDKKIKPSTTTPLNIVTTARNQEVKRWSTKVQLQVNENNNNNNNNNHNNNYSQDLINTNRYSSKPIPITTGTRGTGEGNNYGMNNEESREKELMDEKLDLLRTGGVGGNKSHNRSSSLGQRKSMLPPGMNGLQEGVEDAPPRDLEAKKSVNKLRRKEVQSIQVLPEPIPRIGLNGSNSFSTSAPSRISHYWHDYGDVPNLPSSTISGNISTTSNRKPSPVRTNAGTSVPSSSSNQLASRLEELAISHADGLLDEEEYRMLRSQVFLKFTTSGDIGSETMGTLGEGNEEVPKLDESLFIPRAFGSLSDASPNTPSPSALLSPPPPKVRTPSMSSRARSSISASSSSIFRRNSKSNLIESEDWDVVHPRGLAITDLLNHQQAENLNPLPPSDYTSYQPRSLRGTYPGFPTSTIKGDVRLVPGSSSITGPHSSNGGGGSSSSQSNRSSLLPTPSGGKGGPRVSMNAYTFNSPKSPLAPTPSSLDPFIFASTEVEPNSTELKLEISQLEAERNRLAETWEGLEKVEISKWEEKLGPKGLDHFVNSAKAPSEQGSADLDDVGLNLQEGDLQRTLQLDSTDSRLTNLDLTTSSLPSVSSRQALHSISKPLTDPITLAEEVEVASEALLLKVEEIRNSKRKTEDKYEERLEYLRARLNGALLKEKLAAK